MSRRVHYHAALGALLTACVALSVAPYASASPFARADVLFANNSKVTPGVAQLFALDAASGTVSKVASFS